EARVGAHVLADLLAEVAGVAVGSQSVEEDPERLPRAEREAQDLRTEGACRREIRNEGESGPQAHRQPHRLLAAAAGDLAQRPRRCVELDARLAIAFEAALDPHEDLGVDRLRAGEAAPEAPGDGGEEEQAVR